MVAVIQRDHAMGLLTSTVELRKDLETHLAQ
jgi:hypothetical protein